MDFDKLLSEKSRTAPTEPRELYESLPDKTKGYGYLRDVQSQVLAAWHQRRHERDLAVKVNTGGGKMIDGLVILRSHLNDGHEPRRSRLTAPYCTRPAVMVIRRHIATHQREQHDDLRV